MAYTKGVTHPSGTITNIQFNPNDASQISVIGNMTLRLFRYNEGSLKAMNIRTESKVLSYFLSFLLVCSLIYFRII